MNRLPPKSLSNVWYTFLFCLAAWAAFNLNETVHYILADYSQIPVGDFWRIPQFWADPRTIHWPNLWTQHNEHRIIFPELVHITDMLFLHGRMYLPIAVSGICYLGIWLVLAWTLYSQKTIPSPIREAAMLLAGVVMFWKGCSSVIATPFQLQFTMLQFFSVLSLSFLSLLAETKRNRYLAAIAAAGVICTYSSSNGMLLWIILLAAGLFLKVCLRQLLILGAVAITFSSAYFFRYHFLPSTMSRSIMHPLRAGAFLCSYFSMPFGAYGPRSFGFVIGALNLLLMAACFVFVWRRSLMQSRLGILIFGVYLFTLASALLTTAGRMDQTDYTFALAKAWRYVTMPTVSWALLVVALLWVTGDTLFRRWSLAVVLGLAVFLFLGFRKTADWADGTRQDLANAQITATMLRNGVFDPSQVRTIFPDPDSVSKYMPVLREFHKSIYARGDDKWIGKDLLSLPLQKTAVSGKITRVYPVPGGLEIFGWADTNSLTEDHDILFVNGQNRIVGFGRRPAAGMPANLSTWDTPNLEAFAGYVSLAQPVDQLFAYISTFHGKSIRPLDGPIHLPAFTQLASRSDTATLPGITWLPDTNWTIGGYETETVNGPAPPSSIYASQADAIKRTGAIRTAPFATPAGNCLILPVLQGISSYGLSVVVSDADSGKVIADIPFLNSRSVWRRWRIPIPASARNVKIVADDEGTGQYQWLAVTTPEQCP